jgi:hypothetical protein
MQPDVTTPAPAGSLDPPASPQPDLPFLRLLLVPECRQDEDDIRWYIHMLALDEEDRLYRLERA